MLGAPCPPRVPNFPHTDRLRSGHRAPGRRPRSPPPASRAGPGTATTWKVGPPPRPLVGQSRRSSHNPPQLHPRVMRGECACICIDLHKLPPQHKVCGSENIWTRWCGELGAWGYPAGGACNWGKGQLGAPRAGSALGIVGGAGSLGAWVPPHGAGLDVWLNGCSRSQGTPPLYLPCGHPPGWAPIFPVASISALSLAGAADPPLALSAANELGC